MAAEVEDGIRVKRTSSATGLGSTIAHKVYAGEDVVLKAIGAAAINQAVKAVIIAQSYILHGREEPFIPPQEWTLSMQGGFVTVEMPERDVTAVWLKVLVEK